MRSSLQQDAPPASADAVKAHIERAAAALLGPPPPGLP
jgi:hypothetical protein